MVAVEIETNRNLYLEKSVYFLFFMKHVYLRPVAAGKERGVAMAQPVGGQRGHTEATHRNLGL